MAIAPAITSPVEPSIESVSLWVKVLPPTVILRPFSSIVISPAPATQQRPQPRATTAAWLVMPPVLVRMPAADVHAVDVFGVRFLADEQHLLAGVRALDGFGGGEGQLADRGARRGGQADASAPSALRLLARPGSKLGSSSCVRSPAGMRSTAVFSSISFSLTMSQAIFTAAAPVRLPLRVCSMNSVPLLDRELDVLHVLVVLFERVLDLEQLLVDRLVPLGHFGDGLRRADAGDDVFALGVDRGTRRRTCSRRSTGCG